MARWERLESYLFDHDKGGTEFTAEEYAEEVGHDSIAEGTWDIQSYLRAQRRQDPDTLYVLRRVQGTRTRNARWAVGVRTRDVRAISTGFYDDVRARVHRAFVPDLLAIKAKNPRAAKEVETKLMGIVDGALKVLEAASRGIGPDDDDGSGVASPRLPGM